MVGSTVAQSVVTGITELCSLLTLNNHRGGTTTESKGREPGAVRPGYCNREHGRQGFPYVVCEYCDES